jgi:hypothetical protein
MAVSVEVKNLPESGGFRIIKSIVPMTGVSHPSL